MPDADWLLDSVRIIHEQVRDAIIADCENRSLEETSQIAYDGSGDTIYAIDRISDSLLVKLFDERIASRNVIVLIAEGLPEGKVTLPPGAREQDAVWRIIADPIDGTRCLMYQKRSGWILTGIARNQGDDTTLADIEMAVQTEIPLTKQHLCDSLWARRGKGVQAERINRVTGERIRLTPVPSSAVGLDHGFATICRFFSGGREILASIDDELHFALFGSGVEGKAGSFEDQYPSTGGQLYELTVGHDRFVADLRPLLGPILRKQGRLPSLCCHPYDLCTELIAREAGVLITNELGEQLDARLDIQTDVSWIGYANHEIRELVKPVIQSVMRNRGLVIKPTS